MAPEAVISLPEPSPAADPVRGKRLATAAGLLMWGAALAESWSGYRMEGHMPLGSLMLMSSSGFALVASGWSGVRLGLRPLAGIVGLLFVLVAAVGFVKLLGDLAHPAGNSFHGAWLQTALALPVGLAGLLLTIPAVRAGGRGEIFFRLALGGAWALLPFLFPASLALIAWLLAKKKDYFPAPEAAPVPSGVARPGLE